MISTHCLPPFRKKMWQLLQDRKCLRIGGRESMEVDVRVLCASQEDLKDAVAHGRFLPELCDYLTAVELSSRRCVSAGTMCW